jgi:hypothetical protein
MSNFGSPNVANDPRPPATAAPEVAGSFDMEDLTDVPDEMPCWPKGQYTLRLKSVEAKQSASGRKGLNFAFEAVKSPPGTDLTSCSGLFFHTIWSKEPGDEDLPMFVKVINKGVIKHLGCPLNLGSLGSLEAAAAACNAKAGSQIIAVLNVRSSDEYGKQNNLSKVICAAQS